MDANKISICRSGGLEPIVRGVRDGAVQTAKMALTALANIAEMPENLDRIVDTNAIPFLVSAISEPHEELKREAARALGNLAANIEFGDLILREGALQYLVPMLRSSDHLTQRMGAFCLCSKFIILIHLKFYFIIVYYLIFNSYFRILYLFSSYFFLFFVSSFIF